MTVFMRLNRLPTFRASFGSLLLLDDSELRTLVDEIRRSGGDLDADDDVPDELSAAYSALIVARSIAGEEGFDALLSDVRSV